MGKRVVVAYSIVKKITKMLQKKQQKKQNKKKTKKKKRLRNNQLNQYRDDFLILFSGLIQCFNTWKYLNISIWRNCMIECLYKLLGSNYMKCADCLLELHDSKNLLLSLV